MSHLQSTPRDAGQTLLATELTLFSNLHFIHLPKNSAGALGGSTSGPSFPWSSYILGIVTNFPKNSFLIGPLGLIGFQNRIQRV